MLNSASRASGSPDVPGVSPERVAYLIRTHTTHATRQQAQELGLSIWRVREMRSTLYRAGLLHSTRRRHNRTFTAEERERAVALLKSGMKVRDVAAALGRTRSALVEALRSHGVGVKALQLEARVYSMRQAASLLGVSNAKVRRLCEAGALPLVRTGDTPGMRAKRQSVTGAVVGDRRCYAIAYADIVALLRNRRYWMVWEPEDVADATLRRLAEMYRAAAPGAWVRVRDCAAAQNYAPGTINDWVARGWPGPGWEIETWGTTRYVWIQDGAALPQRPKERHRWDNRRAA